MLKKIGKIFLWIILSILSLIVIYIVIALILTVIPVNKNNISKDNDVEIFIQSNGVHTFITLPAENKIFNWKNFLKPDYFDLEDTSGYEYIMFGWGNKEFYISTPTWADLKFNTAIKAIFTPSESAIHAVLLNYKPETDNKDFSVKISYEQYGIICSYVLQTFKVNEFNNISKIKNVKYEMPGESYFDAEGKYSLFYTCNNWTNDALKVAGIKCGIWTPFEQCIIYRLKKI
jgi:uncharacterized protein (TIGR02117 family)